MNEYLPELQPSKSCFVWLGLILGHPVTPLACEFHLDRMIKSAFKHSPAGDGLYDLFTFVTGCSRQRVYLSPPVQTSLSLFSSQVCLNQDRLTEPSDPVKS